MREVVTSSIGTVLEQIILAKTGFAMSCPECKEDIAMLNAMKPANVMANIGKHANRIVNRAMSRRQPWYLRLIAMAASKLAIATVSVWITEACERHESGEYDVKILIVDDPVLYTAPHEIPDLFVMDRSKTPDLFRGRCVAVTSLSPNLKRAERQALCLQSWRDIGLEVINVESDSKPRIKALLDAGAATGLPFLLINADIEMHGDHTLIEAAIQLPDTLTIGIRYNHAPDAPRGRSRKETAGLDAFLMTPEMAATVPDLPFMIGQPVWDYWLPYHFRRLGYAFHWIDSPLFFHATHELQWSREDWVRGCAWFNDHYGVNLEYGSTAFRQSLEVLI